MAQTYSISSSSSSSAESSLFWTAPQINTPPTTLGKASTSNVVSKSRSVLGALNIPQLFRPARASYSLPPSSPCSASPSSPISSKCAVRTSPSLPPPSPGPSGSSKRNSLINPFIGLRHRLSASSPISRHRFSLSGPTADARPPTGTNRVDPPSPVYRPMKHESRCLQYIAHGIYVAFEDDSRAFGSPGPTTEELRAESGQRFTHIVQIVNSEPTPIITYFTNQNKTRYLRLSTKRHSHHRYELQMSVLTRDPELHDMSPEQADLFLGATYYTTEKMFMPGAEGVARLRPKQMVAAREFIRLSGAASSAGRISPRVLITAPRDHRTDIISIVACFLSATSGKCAAEVVNSINNQREMKTVWQGCVSRKGVEYIQGLAWE